MGPGSRSLGVLGGTRRPGVDVVLELVDLDAALDGAVLVVTGEGALDRQTSLGKAVGGVARLAARHLVPAVAVCGVDLLSRQAARRLGLAATYPLSDLEPDPARSLADARDLVRRTASRVATEWLTGPGAGPG